MITRCVMINETTDDGKGNDSKSHGQAYCRVSPATRTRGSAPLDPRKGQCPLTHAWIDRVAVDPQGIREGSWWVAVNLITRTRWGLEEGYVEVISANAATRATHERQSESQ
jgi:hypothetical protein